MSADQSKNWFQRVCLAESVKYESIVSVNYDSTESVKYDSGEGVRYDSTESVRYDSTESVMYDSTESVKYDSTDNVKYGSTESVKYDLTESVKYDSKESVRYGSTESVTYDSTESIKYDSSESVKYDSTDNVKYGSTKSVKYDSTESVKYDSKESVRHGSTESVTYDSTESVKYDSTESAAQNKALILLFILVQKQAPEAGESQEKMSLFRKNKKKKPKSPKITGSSQDYALWKRPESEFQQKERNAKLSQSVSVSSENLPVLQSSPYGSLRDIPDNVSLPPTTSYRRYQSPDSRSVTSNVSYVSSNQSSDFTDYSNSLSPPHSQRLAHYNRHKTSISKFKAKKREKDETEARQSPLCTSLNSIESNDKLPCNNNEENVSLIFETEEMVCNELVSQAIAAVQNSSPTCIPSTPVDIVDGSFSIPLPLSTASVATTSIASNSFSELSQPEVSTVHSEKKRSQQNQGSLALNQIKHTANLVATEATGDTAVKIDKELDDVGSPSSLSTLDFATTEAAENEESQPTMTDANDIEPLTFHRRNVELLTLVILSTSDESISSSESLQTVSQLSQNATVCVVPSDISAIEGNIVSTSFAQSLSAFSADLIDAKDPPEIAAQRYNGEGKSLTSTDSLDNIEDELQVVFSEKITPIIIEPVLQENLCYLSAGELDMAQEKGDSLSDQSTNEGESSSQPLIKMTPSSSANLHGLDTVVASREYRLSTDADADDEDLLFPHTPVAADLNVSYPNSEHEDSDPVHPKANEEFQEAPLIDETKKSEELHKSLSVVETSSDTISDDTNPKISEETVFGFLQNTFCQNWPAFTCAAIAAGIGAAVIARMKYFSDS
ncbi:fap1 adhesin-like [Watersipora subatra]|uniref:fap1 adhesin-like n=1 Tax=Watersipora subatra TaxID=2589382 RepID=UPI00355AF676